MKIKLYYFEMFFAVFSLLLFFDVLLPLYEKSFPGKEQVYDTIYLFLGGFSYFISFLIIIRKYKIILLLIKNNTMLFALIFLALISTLWSVNPNLTMIRSIGLLGTTIFAMFLFIRFDINMIIELFIYTLVIICVLCIYMCVFNPALGIHSDVLHDGLWRGIFAHKNILSRSIGLAIIFPILYIFENKIFTYTTVFSICGIVMSILLMYFANGKTGILGVIFTIFLIYPILSFKYLLDRFKNIKVIIFISSFLISIFLIYLVSINSSVIINAVGGDVTLTGRVLLWPLVLEAIYIKPILGFGFGSFWASPAANEILNYINWLPPHAHNGFLEILLDIGLVGLLLFTILIGKIFIRSAMNLSFRNREAIIIIVIMFYLIVTSIPGSSIISQNSIPWVLFVYFNLILTKRQISFFK